MSEFFKGIPVVEYEGPRTENLYAFRYYNPDEAVAGKPMRGHLKFALSYWHTMCGAGADQFGRDTADKTFGGATPEEIYENRAYAAFELMDKLRLDYFCFHDRDIAPEGKTLAETDALLDRYARLLKDLMARHRKKLLWGTANLFSHPRYMHGAATSCEADVFAFAAAQVKKAIDITHLLGGDGYVFWGGREGYDTLLNTDLALENDNLARFLRMAAEYARSIGFGGDFYLEPKPKEPTTHQYDYDVATTLSFLRKYGLHDDFKLNIEANHATLAGHSFQHELRTARLEGRLGSVDANQGDARLGWDVDRFPTNVYETALCMYEILKMGGFTKGGLNFDAKTRRASFEPSDIILSYIAGMDAYALGLRVADRLIQDGRLDRFVEERYQSYHSGIGAKIVAGQTSLPEMERYALALGEVGPLHSGRQEYLESIVNAMLFG